MKRYKTLLLLFILILSFNYIYVPSVGAYSYGDPGKEDFAEAYKEIDAYASQGDWELAEAVFETYEKEFDLYFKKPKELIDEAFETKDLDLLLGSYQAALALNIERRLHFAEDSFEEYGQAKLLLAKARGTYDILHPLAVEKLGQDQTEEIYKAFDDALTALGNPGLFGIGNKEQDPETFKTAIELIISLTAESFPLPNDKEADESHLTEENLGIDTTLSDESHPFWLWFTIALATIFVVLVIVQQRRKKKMS
ncbi:hypothetical protein [Bacillus kexueae]|uniref:hypothetical protein n=1 Tax=Aeribacillus kexueae TaxID=2078952 RepID=UPI001FAFA1C2|nr:hypothetical protein [Bacillus kexueae]